MKDDEKARRARAEMPVTGRKTYLNTGTAGPLARVTQEALEAGGRFDYETGTRHLQQLSGADGRRQRPASGLRRADGGARERGGAHPPHHRRHQHRRPRPPLAGGRRDRDHQRRARGRSAAALRAEAAPRRGDQGGRRRSRRFARRDRGQARPRHRAADPAARDLPRQLEHRAAHADRVHRRDRPRARRAHPGGRRAVGRRDPPGARLERGGLLRGARPEVAVRAGGARRPVGARRAALPPRAHLHRLLQPRGHLELRPERQLHARTGGAALRGGHRVPSRRQGDAREPRVAVGGAGLAVDPRPHRRPRRSAPAPRCSGYRRSRW